MKNAKTKAGNIFASIKEEEIKESRLHSEPSDKNSNKEKTMAEGTKKPVNQPEKEVDASVNIQSQVDSATIKPETLAKTTDTIESAPERPLNTESSNSYSNNPGINYLNQQQNMVETPVNNGLLYIVPTKKKTRNHRKGFLLSDLALENLQKEAAKYEISENELINQILEKMV